MITSIYTCILGIMFVFLSIRVIKGRVACSTAIGDGGHAMLQQRIRAQGNFAEYTPLFLIMMAMAEVGGVYGPMLHAIGVFFVIGRISHAYAFLKVEKMENGDVKKVSRYRIRGMALTFFGYICLGAILTYQIFFRLFASF